MLIYPTISEECLSLAEIQIKIFLELLENLGYDDRMYRYNTHCRLHLIEDCRNHGPLRYINSYAYQNYRDIIKIRKVANKVRSANL